MKCKHHFNFLTKEHRKLVKYLKKNNIQYEVVEGIDYASLDIYEDSIHYDIIKEFLKDDTVSVETEYSKKEYKEASWYRVRSKWRPGYPQPEDTFWEKTFEEGYCHTCGHGSVQIAPFRIKKEVEWKKRHFFQLLWVENELFVKSETAKILIESGLKGFDIKDVMINKKNVVSETVKQIYVKEELNNGLIVDDGIQKVFKCEECHTDRYVGSGKPVHFKKSIFDSVNVDIVKSKEQFGEIVANSHRTFISKKFYDLIVEHKLDRNLSIEPVMFID